MGTTPTAGSSLASHGFPPGICSEQLNPGGILPIDDPAFAADWSDVDPPDAYGDLADDDTVVGVEREGRVRAYPVSVLWHHEVVTDRVGGPLLVTYCSLCRSGMVAERRVEGEPTGFGVSGLLWRAPAVQQRASEDANRSFAVDAADASDDLRTRNAGNLVLYDARTGSYWSQVLARAICGPRTGDTLRVVPVTTATWRVWRRDYPDTEVLLPPPRSSTGNPPVPDDSTADAGGG
jgi:hypothetical protein